MHGPAWRLATGLAFLVLLASVERGSRGALAQATGPWPATVYQFDNGLDVVLVENHAAPAVAVTVWYRVGGANDPPGRSGFAHLFEHMMFQGSADVPPGAHLELVARAGGNTNATTGRDRTRYFETLPAEQLPLALWLEADRMRSLVVDEATFERERAVVQEEYRLRYQNRPYGEARLLLETLPFTYPPYQQRTIGSIEDLDQATADEVRAFHDAYYTPNNATLVVAGDVDIPTTRELVQRYFGAIPRGQQPPALPPYVAQLEPPAAPVTVEDRLARVPALIGSYVIPPRGEADYYAAEVLGVILGQGRSSRLARALVDSGLAARADTQVDGNRGPSLLSAVLVPNPNVDVARLEAVYSEEVDRIRGETVDAAELAKAVNQIRAARLSSFETALGVADAIQAAAFYLGDATAVLTEIERYQAVTPDDVSRVARQYLAPERRHVIHVILATAEGQ
jgi:predicted Zn-dependent peptidase